MARLCPSAMLFVRCRGGISHNPAEFASVSDMGVAIAALIRFIERFQRRRRDRMRPWRNGSGIHPARLWPSDATKDVAGRARKPFAQGLPVAGRRAATPETCQSLAFQRRRQALLQACAAAA